MKGDGYQSELEAGGKNEGKESHLFFAAGHVRENPSRGIVADGTVASGLVSQSPPCINHDDVVLPATPHAIRISF